MLSASQLKNGVVFEYQDSIYRVLKYTHTHISRRGADIKVKVRDLIKGSVLNLSLSPSDKFDQAYLQRRQLQYLYKDESYHFMDSKTFEQVAINKNIVGDQGVFLKEGEEVTVLFWTPCDQDQPQAIDLELPISIVYTIAQTDPGEKGDTASNSYKPATMDNGLKVKVPLFIKVGDKIKVDTRSGEYSSRA